MINIVLLKPEIPGNTGNIGRTCTAVGASLHLIEPLGFRLTEKYLKRAGMDYWDRLDVHRWKDLEDFMAHHAGANIYYVTTKGKQLYTDVAYEPDCYLMFGRESSGIPETILTAHKEACVRIPMADGERSLNLSNAAAIVTYEVLRQWGFPGLQTEGKPLKTTQW